MSLFIFFFAFILFFSPVSDAISIPTGGPAPDFTLSTLEGDKVSLSSFRGRTVVLIYWRTGQERSLLALKDGNEMLRKFRDKGVEVMGVIAGSDSAVDARRIIKDNGITYPVLVDTDRDVYGGYGIRVYPTTVIINSEGILARDIPGHSLTYKKVLEEYIRNAVGETDDRELEEALSVHREKKDRSVLEASRLYNLAVKFTEAGMHELAIDTVRKSIEAGPGRLKPYILLGFLYLETEEADKALEAFNRALELEPLSKDAKTGLGGALVLKGEVDRAIEVLNDAAVANPYPQMTYYELGRAYELKGEKDRSMEMYKKAVEKIIKRRVLPSSISRCQ
ncbi:MAG: redoxin domain-containing protein [Deferribacteres bacterium]|nr:redoxin domain-containing protein [Deferribacteres bacterium]